MPSMRIDLQEGFNSDDVEVYVNGAKVRDWKDVTTKRMLGLAASAELEVPDGALDIEVKVPTKNLAKTFSVASSDTPNLGISIHNGELKSITSKKRFGYA
ncbi:MAG TPA: hypothetical protein VN644_15175 [Pyrinomonadaceae bacterium]|jgi:hypothetical protein|nr:hypothetical protein [Pyrinomonadaceae bacterium]